VKLYLRQLPDPILMSSNMDLIRLVATLPASEQIRALQRLVRSLPIPNYIFLAYLFDHLTRVSQFEETNKMTCSGLAVCFGPTLFWTREDVSEIFSDSSNQQTVAQILLDNCTEIFGKEPLKCYQSYENSKYYRLIQEQEPNWPFALNIPVDSIVQVVAADNSGWTIAVWNDQWGVVPKRSLEIVTDMQAILTGIASQEKWKIGEKELEEMNEKCPEAVELYGMLQGMMSELRGRFGTNPI
jgi:hypothetical protein